jgi:hypothetical protein
MTDDVDAGMIARSQHIAERRARARSVASSPRVRVLPRDETIRKYISHQPSGIAFPATGSVEWPNDRFTQRRVAEGDVTIEDAEEKKAEPRRTIGGDV